MGIVTLPTYVSFAMGSDIDPGNSSVAGGLFSMTATTEFSRTGFGGEKLPGTHPMFFRRFMTTHARNVDVMGKGFGSGYGCVTRFTLAGRLRRFGIVRFVTGDTGFDGIVRS